MLYEINLRYCATSISGDTNDHNENKRLRLFLRKNELMALSLIFLVLAEGVE